MTETPVQFGPTSSLIGVVTRPEGDAPPSLAFIVFNAGVLPRIGPHRLNVKMARDLARTGQTTLRFDLSGQGDSRSAVSRGDFRTQAVADLRHAMDHLEQTLGIHRFALIGVCSGAVNAHAAAVADARVVGVLLFDGYWYASRWTRWMRIWKRFNAQPWRDTLAAAKRRLPRAPRPAKASAAKPPDPDDVTVGNVPRAEFIDSMHTLTGRGVSVYLMYSGSVLDYYSYANQFRDVFRNESFLPQVRCDHCPDIDHTFVSLHSQARMIDSVQAWAVRMLRGGSAGP